MAKAIVNSPLVKTAVNGGDPNWGRVAMAIGKCSDDTDIDQDAVVIRFGTDEVYPKRSTTTRWPRCRRTCAAATCGSTSACHRYGEATVWGCDLSADYVHINADYTT